ncbi:hypothetical protein AZE42_12270 [Rhizopogon vesiculosus]|uniref:Uncharacterized protein n=1 Tax=Rhizopogon vesiculosus TaxID=180088 RepID=A0A1J8QN59_9AGAM|nr:hypothetical protein AZE42_12270 [Rhizopogon vesiculosus]
MEALNAEASARIFQENNLDCKSGEWICTGSKSKKPYHTRTKLSNKLDSVGIHKFAS